ncbi:1-phosphofructokinase [Ligilactobacillus equi]|nr:1-phosphofructokinase [Ligilactobacillus equi]
MIYTITLNPAIDLAIETETLRNGVVNRTNFCDIQPNGKGVNVSIILKKLNVDNIALGIGGGFTLDFISDSLKSKGITNKFWRVEQPTRINVFTKVVSTGEEFKEVNPGPTIPKNLQEKLLTYLKKHVTCDDWIIVSGSFSKGISPSYLEDIAKISREVNCGLVIDSSYKEVLDILKYNPYLIKPNEEELLEWFDDKNRDDMNLDILIEYGQNLIERGARNVLLSLGDKGACLITNTNVYVSNAPKIKLQNSAGSGDTMLGTFMGEIINKVPTLEAFKRSIAAGSDTAQSTGLTDFKTVSELEKQVKITCYSK